MQTDFVNNSGSRKLSFIQQLILAIIAVLVILISGSVYIYYAQGRGKPLALFFKELEAQQVTLQEQIPELQFQKIVAYQRGRNPFNYAKKLLKKGQGLLLEFGLKAFPTDVLKLIGIVSLEDRFWAIIETPDGQVHRATVGTEIGQNYGHIVKITNQQVDIVEKRSAEEGRWVEYSTSLTLETAPEAP